jgi:Flp pilus assembly protein TadB
LTGLSPSARKALSVQIGEHAGGEIADLIQRMAAEIEELKRTKVSITRIVPGGEPR